MTYTYAVNGVAMTDPAGRWFLDPSTTRRLVPEVRSTAAQLPGMHGETHPTRDKFASGALGLTLYVTDNTAAGKPGGPIQTEKNLELLTAVFSAPRLTVTLTVDGLTRTNVGRRTSSVEAKARAAALTTYEMPVVIRFPSPFWRDPAATTTQASLPTTKTTVALPALAGGSAPVADSVLRFAGPFTGRISAVDQVSGTGVVYEGTLISGWWLYIDTATVTAWAAESADRWDPNASGYKEDATADLDYLPAGPLELWPNPATGLSYAVVVSRPTALAAAGAFGLRAKGAYL